jgi:hypothetical protein
MQMDYILWAMRHPCGTYESGQQLCALSGISESISAQQTTAGGSGQACRALRTSVHLLVTLNSDPRSDVAQWGRAASKREGEVGGSVSVGIKRDLAYRVVGGM